MVLLAFAGNGGVRVAEVGAPARVASLVAGSDAGTAKAVGTPLEDHSQTDRKECMSVSMREVKAGAADEGLLDVQVAYGFTFSREYPLALCGIVPGTAA